MCVHYALLIVIIIFHSISYASYASSDVPWRRMLPTRCFGLWPTLESTTAMDSWLPVRSIAAGKVAVRPPCRCKTRSAAPHRASVSDIMRRQLNWLEMPDRVRCKRFTLVYRCSMDSPHYSCPISARPPPRCTLIWDHLWHLSSRCQSRGQEPKRWVRADSASSAAWNALPVHLRDPELSSNTFKVELKTLFADCIYHFYLFLFVVRTNVMTCKLARASVCIELNWNNCHGNPFGGFLFLSIFRRHRGWYPKIEHWQDIPGQNSRSVLYTY